MKQLNLYPIFTLLFFFSLSISLAQQNAIPANKLSNQLSQNASIAVRNEKVATKNDFTDEWYNEAVNNLQQLEYNFYPQTGKDHFKVANIKNHISFEIEPAHYSVQNSIQYAAKSWKMNFGLKGIGRNVLSWMPSSNYSTTNKDGTLAYKFNDVTVEYVNNEEGLRQNFLVEKKPSGIGSLRVVMSVTGNLSASLNNSKLSFFEKNDTSVKLVYSDLKVLDADNKALPSYMQYDKVNHELNLIVDDSKAAYPVLIDPLNQSPEWNTSVDGLLSSVLTNLQMKTALYGFTVTSLGDINGDTYGDVAISAPGLVDIFSGTGSLAAVGAVFIYYGTFSGLPATPTKTLQPNTAVAGALFGYSVDAGDVTGDGRNDIIIGAPLDKYTVHVETSLLGGPPFGAGPLYSNLEVKAGKVYVYKSEDLPSGPNPSSFLQIKLSNSFFSPGLLGLLGNNINVSALFGYSVAVTDDLNGDNKADIIIGAPAYVGTNLLSVQNGNAFVYYSDNLSTTTPAQLQVPAPSLLGLVQLPVINSSSLLFGYSVDGVGDYNNDGYADVVVGAPAGVDLSSLGGIFSGQVLGGSAYVYYGNGSGITTSIGARLQASSTGLLSNAANLFGFKVKGMRNISGQRSGNIMIGAPVGGLIPNALSLSIQTGNINLFTKKSSSPAGVVTPSQVIESPRSSSLLSVLNTLHLSVLFGASFDNAYDINCDSYPDLVVGEPLSTGTNISQLQMSPVGGSAYIYYGMSDGTYNSNPVYTATATYGGDFLSVNATALFGFSVAGLPKLSSSAKPRILVGSPSGALDFGSSMLNLGSTLNVLFSFAAGDNGLGKAYSFDPGLCGAIHTLPEKLITFTGQKIGKNVELDWVTVAEDNVNQYVLEKSVNGTDFGTMAYIFAKGNTSRNTYSMIDYHPVNGVNYYRLRIIEKDNTYSYSQVIRIKFDEQLKGDVIVAPNPVENDFKILMTGLDKGSYTIEIKNTSGQTVQLKNINVTQNEYIENMSRTNSMATGIYYLNVYNKNSKQVKVIKFMIK